MRIKRAPLRGTTVMERGQGSANLKITHTSEKSVLDESEVCHIKEEVEDQEEPPVSKLQTSPLSPVTRKVTSPFLPTPTTTQAMGAATDSAPIKNFPLQKQCVTYSLPSQLVQTSLGTFIMHQPSVQSCLAGISSAGSRLAGGMLDVPTLSDSEGPFGFSVTVEEKERTNKSPMWLMSQVTQKLYTNINKSVPFEIHLKKLPPEGVQLYVRAVPVFSSPQFLRTNVTRCPNHAAPTDPTNHDFPYPEYVVRADHPRAEYVKSETGRLGVVVPLDKLQRGPDYTPVLLRFMCLGSCVGGINRRSIAISLTLENEEGEDLGRKLIHVRVCACPTRDIKTDEQTIMGTKRKNISGQEKKVKKVKVKESSTETEEDDQYFTILVRGRPLYNFLMSVKHSYYTTHPEYAQKFPDISIHHDSSVTVKKEMHLDEVEGEHETVEAATWENENPSPTRELPGVGKNPLNALEGTIASGSSLDSQTGLLLVNGNEVNQEEITTGNVDITSQPQGTKNSATGISMKVNESAVIKSRHIPVRQVSSYKPSIRRVHSEPKNSRRQPIGIPSVLPSTHRQVVGSGVRTSPVKIEELSPAEESFAFPGSKELLAANVLSERFFEVDKD